MISSGPVARIERLTIAICMFERLSVRETLKSLAAMTIPPGVELQIIVVDNNVLSLSRDAVVQHAGRLGLALHYIHAPACNISVARNASLAAADGEWLAFIDDDEEVSSEWFVHAWATACAGADVVFGPVRAVYDDRSAPGWMIDGDFHSTGMAPRDPADKGYCGNVLLRLNTLRRTGLRFDPKLGRIGGEDSDYFRRLHRTGARFAFASGAVVRETVPPDRATLGWLCRRRFRTGQIHVLISATSKADRFRIGTASLAKCGWAVAAALGNVGNRSRCAASLQRAMFHAGAVAAALGRDPLAAYG